MCLNDSQPGRWVGRSRIESPGLFSFTCGRGRTRRAAGARLHLRRLARPGQPRRRRHVPRLHHDRGLCQRHHARLHHQPRFRLGSRARQRQMEFAGRRRGAGDARRSTRSPPIAGTAKVVDAHGPPGAARECRPGGRGHARRPHARRRHTGGRGQLRAVRHARCHRSACAMRERDHLEAEKAGASRGRRRQEARQPTTATSCSPRARRWRSPRTCSPRPASPTIR